MIQIHLPKKETKKAKPENSTEYYLYIIAL
jgi:hypothetical protein